MTVLTTHNLGKHYGAQDVFDGLTLTVNQGDRIALVGPNGEGKTTLLRILAGLEPASAGMVHTAKGLKLGYLEQHPSLISTSGNLWELALSAFADLRLQEAALHDLTAALAAETDQVRHEELLAQYGEAEARFEHAGGYTYEQTIDQVLTGLGFKREEYETPLAHLSGGQQSRAHLAHLLLNRTASVATQPKSGVCGHDLHGAELPEVFVERKGRINAQPLHHDVARAVGEAPRLVGVLREHVPRGRDVV
jgi:ATP-binding cassette subfamily F protein 3